MRKRPYPIPHTPSYPSSPSRRAFTLIELAIVITLIGVLSVVGTLGLLGRKQTKDLQSVQLGIVALLHEAQSRSITQDQNAAWGVYFANNTTTASFYDLFYGSYSTSTVVSQYVLPSDVQFASSSVSQGGSLTLTFAEITGMPSASTSITLDLVSGGGTAAALPASLGLESSGEVFFDNFNRSSL